MAKKKPDGSKPPSRPREGRNLNIWIDAALGEQIDAYLASLGLRVPLTSFAEAAFREFLRSKGFWPAKPD